MLPTIAKSNIIDVIINNIKWLVYITLPILVICKFSINNSSQVPDVAKNKYSSLKFLILKNELNKFSGIISDTI